MIDKIQAGYSDSIMGNKSCIQLICRSLRAALNVESVSRKRYLRPNRTELLDNAERSGYSSDENEILQKYSNIAKNVFDKNPSLPAAAGIDRIVRAICIDTMSTGGRLEVISNKYCIGWDTNRQFITYRGYTYKVG